MATIRARERQDGGTVYQVQVRLRGYPTQTASFARKTDAKDWAQRTESAIREGRHFKNREARRHTLHDALDRYRREKLPAISNQPSMRGHLDWWDRELGAYTMADVTPALIVGRRDSLATEILERTKQPRSPSTVNRYLETLSSVLSAAVKEWQWLDDTPMRKVSKLRQPQGRVRFLDDDERKALLEACKESSHPYLETIVILALSTGARFSELMNLRWSNVDMDRGFAYLHETKNNERRAIPLVGLALKKLRVLSKVRRIDTDLLFPREDGKKPVTIQKPWRKSLADAGIEDFRFHDLRHSCASYLAMNGASLAEIAAVLGHKTLSMVKRYSHLSEQHTASVVKSMNEKIFGDG